jgi:hypothetical protein
MVNSLAPGWPDRASVHHSVPCKGRTAGFGTRGMQFSHGEWS